jgi:hypothetical protein
MSQSALVKVGLPSHLAEGARGVRRMRQILDQRDAAMARIETECRQRMKALLEETEAEITDAVATSGEAQETTSLPS